MNIKTFLSLYNNDIVKPIDLQVKYGLIYQDQLGVYKINSNNQKEYLISFKWRDIVKNIFE